MESNLSRCVCLCVFHCIICFLETVQVEKVTNRRSQSNPIHFESSGTHSKCMKIVECRYYYHYQRIPYDIHLFDERHCTITIHIFFSYNQKMIPLISEPMISVPFFFCFSTRTTKNIYKDCTMKMVSNLFSSKLMYYSSRYMVIVE